MKTRPAANSVYNLQTCHPELTKEWHNDRNAPHLPTQFVPGSTFRAFWRCEYGHIWDAPIRRRVRGEGCPFCSGRRTSAENCLAGLKPEIAKQWHQTENIDKNGRSLTPFDVTWCSGYKAVWICDKGKLSEHKWRATVHDRTKKNNQTGHGSGCPFCSGHTVCLDNCLVMNNPELAKELHPIKNIDAKNNILTAYNLGCKSDRKVFWLCNVCSHVWAAKLWKRHVRGDGCPKCSRQSSLPELLYYSQTKWLIPDAENGVVIKGINLDIFSKELMLAIEYDGYPWHKTKEKSDRNKNRKLSEIGIKTLRVRDSKLGRIEDEDLLVDTKNSAINILDLKRFAVILRKVMREKGIELQRVDDYIDSDFCTPTNLPNYEMYLRDKSNMVKGVRKNNLTITHPDLAAEIHLKKNGKIRGEHLTFGSSRTIIWECRHCKTNWNAKICNRTYGWGKCPTCFPRTKTRCTS